VEILSTMSQRARRWFLLWGLIIAVFAIVGFFFWKSYLHLNNEGQKPGIATD